MTLPKFLKMTGMTPETQPGFIRRFIYTKTRYKNYLELSRQMMRILKSEFECRAIEDIKFSHNTMHFCFFGFCVCVKTEIADENETLYAGKLVASIKQNNNITDALLTYNFTSQGKINENYSMIDFSKFFYHELVLRVIEAGIKRSKVTLSA